MRPAHSVGLGLLELLIALALGLVLALAATSALLAMQRTLAQLDAASQLAEDTRFASEILRRLLSQVDIAPAPAASSFSALATAGLQLQPPSDSGPWPSVHQANGGDVLILHHPVGIAESPLQGPDAQIDCAGFVRLQRTASASASASALAPVPAPTHMTSLSILYLGLGSDAEPALMCARAIDGALPLQHQALVRGVEHFQVLYGLFGTAKGGDAGAVHFVPASHIAAANDLPQTAGAHRWDQLCCVRIRMVLRSPPLQHAPPRGLPGYPFGPPDSASQDAVIPLHVPTDNRLRRVLTITLFLRHASSP